MGDSYPICIKVGEENEYLTEFGHWDISEHGKCVIFPKGKTTWEGFQRPFKDGDILVGKANQPFIFQSLNDNDGCFSYCGITADEKFCLHDDDWSFANSLRFATEEEKQKLFKIIQDNGYKWNAETKTLEKIEPKFKVGDKVRPKNQHEVRLISEVWDNLYLLDEKNIPLPFSAQDDWELAPGKFDLSTLVPFESKVLVRDHEEATWRPAIWGFYDEREDITYPYIIVGGVGYARCIPYESNEHLLNTADKCEDFYKNWE
jgi:hypothetical protein